jgi:hypothetical protein
MRKSTEKTDARKVKLQGQTKEIPHAVLIKVAGGCNCWKGAWNT